MNATLTAVRHSVARAIIDLCLGTLLFFVIGFALVSPPLELVDPLYASPALALAFWSGSICIVRLARRHRGAAVMEPEPDESPDEKFDGDLYEGRNERWLEGDTMLEPAIWRAKLEESERRVCRIEMRGIPVGTGFLIGPNLLATCHHVVSALIDGTVAPERMAFRFDFQLEILHGSLAVVAPGRSRPLATDWLVFSSPAPVVGPRSRDALDLVLLRLAEQPSDADRGNFVADPRRVPWTMKGGVLVLQHPQGQDLKAAYAPHKRVAPLSGQSGVEITYGASTLPGASGAPVLNSEHELLGMHQAAGPDTAQWNLGLRADLIGQVLKDVHSLNEGKLP